MSAAISEPEPGHDERTRPRLPLWIAIVSIVLALVAGSFLVYVLYKETKGPGEILREFARRVDRLDCAGSYELLDPGLRSGVSEEAWCSEILSAVDASLDSDFTLERAVLEGDVAYISLSGADEWTEWVLCRHGERSWRVAGTPEGGPFGVSVIPGEFSCG